MTEAPDADMAALRLRFLARLPERRRRIEVALAHWQAGEDDFETLCREAHSLAGAAALHACPILSQSARKLEHLLRQGATQSASHAACVALLACLDAESA